MNGKLLTCATAGVLLCVTAVLAGHTYLLRCNSSKCAYKPAVRVGGGFQFDQASGFCTKCEKFVFITWKHDAEPPKPIGTVWEPTSGKKCALYPCPTCKSTLLDISALPLLLATIGKEPPLCPKCTNGVLTLVDTGDYD